MLQILGLLLLGGGLLLSQSASGNTAGINVLSTVTNGKLYY